MPKYQYRVVPFLGKINEGQDFALVSKQLAELIAKNVYDTWELDHITNVNIEVKPGCLSGFLGHKADYVRLDQLIFRRLKEEDPLEQET